jgi:hypothetical protein
MISGQTNGISAPRSRLIRDIADEALREWLDGVTGRLGRPWQLTSGSVEAVEAGVTRRFVKIVR